MTQSIVTLLIGCVTSACALGVWYGCRRLHTRAFCLAPLVLLVVLFCGLHLRLNLTHSMPVGLYRLRSLDVRSLYRGMIVVVCLPPTIARVARERGYVGNGMCAFGIEPLLKRVEGLPGDRIVMDRRGTSVNGIQLPESRPVALDGQGRPLVSWPVARLVVPRGTVWLMGEHPRSWDARYWGPVPSANLIAAATPILVRR